ncbi:MAG: hypothetical protein LBO69_07055 [Ignavibacteria bacterium]|jgi:hypothetical protein|nr:hypothetical protein [Ignavibacteria bacterium]
MVYRHPDGPSSKTNVRTICIDTVTADYPHWASYEFIELINCKNEFREYKIQTFTTDATTSAIVVLCDTTLKVAQIHLQSAFLI